MASSLLGLIILVVVALGGLALVGGLVFFIVRAARPKTPPARQYHPGAPQRPHPGQGGPQYPQGPPGQGWGPPPGGPGPR
ncbi:hypothetical protein [Nocardiopsis sp. NPDC057823]|uniref:hypothetical protein n=1 Tax=Nocardiopsis sp. NPDC057823 TaxID=3346256 RepID=UPI00366B072E